MTPRARSCPPASRPSLRYNRHLPVSIHPATATVSATLALAATVGCTTDPADTDATDASTSTSTGAHLTSTAPTDTDTDTITSPTDPGTTTAYPTTTTAPPTTTADTTSDPAWCNGFDPNTPGLTVHNDVDAPIMNGTPLTVQCGGQGILMIPIYPHFGGFTPTADDVQFDIILDVDGFNLGPNDHFFEATAQPHRIDCGPYSYGYGYSFIPIFPPDGIPDINAIDTASGHLALTLHTPDGALPFAADVVMAADITACGYYGYDTD